MNISLSKYMTTIFPFWYIIIIFMYHNKGTTFRILIENREITLLYNSYYIRTTIIAIYLPSQIYQIVISIPISIFIIMRISLFL
jgi:hypothetical protein